MRGGGRRGRGGRRLADAGVQDALLPAPPEGARVHPRAAGDRGPDDGRPLARRRLGAGPGARRRQRLQPGLPHHRRDPLDGAQRAGAAVGGRRRHDSSGPSAHRPVRGLDPLRLRRRGELDPGRRRPGPHDQQVLPGAVRRRPQRAAPRPLQGGHVLRRRAPVVGAGRRRRRASCWRTASSSPRCAPGGRPSSTPPTASRRRAWCWPPTAPSAPARCSACERHAAHSVRDRLR